MPNIDKLAELEKRIEKLEKAVFSDNNSSKKTKKNNDKKSSKPEVQDEFASTPGIEGIFDGFFMTAADGNKIEVPANYAAKSRLVYGDTLKCIDVNGEQKFKNIKKVSRKKVQGMLSKKEDEIYVLTEFGAHKISSNAIEHNELKVGDLVEVFLPEENPQAPYAAFDKLITTKSNGQEQKDEQHEEDLQNSQTQQQAPQKDVKEEENKDTVVTTSTGTFNIGDDDLM